MSNDLYVPRTLFWIDADGERHRLGEDDLARQSGPVVVLAEPGGGKTGMLKHVATVTGAPYLTAAEWLRKARPATLVDPARPILIDALDEASMRRDGDAVQRVLEKLDAAGTPRFVLSCRAADWEARAATGIGQDYGIAPLICHLEPFTPAQAVWLMQRLCPAHDAVALIARLADKGLETLAGSPLTLDLVAKVVNADGGLPASRAALYEAATRALWTEHDAGRDDGPLARLTDTEALDAAGAIFAALLLSGRQAVATTGPGLTGPDAISLHELRGLPGAAGVLAVSGSKLFRLDAPGRLVPLHRTIAEYLGARWLARTTGRHTRDRLLACLQPGGAVPARVRGLHAWLPHFDDALGRGAIAADPFGVIRHGDADALSLGLARHLLDALVALAARDPWFRSQDWARHPVGALMRAELAPEIEALVASPASNDHLRSLLIEGMVKTSLARLLAPTLETIVRDRRRFYRERIDALKILEDDRDADWKRRIMDYLRREGTRDATRLALGMLNRLGVATTGVDLAVAVLTADMGLALCTLPRERRRTHMLRAYLHIVAAVPDNLIPRLLDLLADHATMAMSHVNPAPQNDIADVIAALAVRVLPTLPLAAAPRLAAWLRPLGKAYHYHRETLARLNDLLADRADLRRAVQRHILFTLRPDDDLGTAVLMALRRPAALQPSHDDLVALLATLAPADRDDPQVRADWCELVAMLRGADGLPAALVPPALDFAGNDAELLAHLDKMRRPRPPRTLDQWEREHIARQAAREARRAARFARHRAAFTRNRMKLRAGDPGEIGSIGKAYLRGFIDLDGQTPLDRLETWLGAALAADALVGLEAVLHRHDLPDPATVAAAYAAGTASRVGLATLAGVSERVRSGRGLAGVPDRALLLANLHRDWCWPSDSDSADAIKAALDDAVAGTPARFEAWHRLRIEPQLAREGDPVDHLYDVTHHPRFPEVARRLCAEWLLTCPALTIDVERRLVDALLRAGEHEAVRAASARAARQTLPDRAAALFWLAVDWIADVADSAIRLHGIGREAPDFLPVLHDRLGLDRHRPGRPSLPVAQAAWLVSEFRACWPLVDRFGEEAEDWGADAAEMLQGMIDRIAADAGEDAAVALDRLAAAPADSYSATLRHAVAGQRQIRSETLYRPMTPADLGALLADGTPATIDDLRALVLAELAIAQAMLRGNDTDRIVEFWTDAHTPRDENRCRDRLADLIGPGLERYGIQRIPERDMPKDKRADLAFVCGAMQLPMEIKGQWHRDVWDAATGQLDRHYLRDWRSEDRGIYVVLWFGRVPGKEPYRLSGGKAPATPAAMTAMLVDRIPPARRHAIAVTVLDLTR